MKKLIVFDLDGTITRSKQVIDVEMVNLLFELLKRTKIAIVSGESYNQFKKQFLDHIHSEVSDLKNIFLFPTCATAFFRYSEDGWMNVYQEKLTQREKSLIESALDFTIKRTEVCDGLNMYGERIEDRQTQITFSAFGQAAPLEVKKDWDKDKFKRRQMKVILDNIIPEFEVHIGGSSSIDVTKKGIDKAYAVQQMEKFLGIKKEDMVFIGDALYEGGNDYPVKSTGVECIEVENEEETKKIIKEMLNEDKISTNV